MPKRSKVPCSRCRRLIDGATGGLCEPCKEEKKRHNVIAKENKAKADKWYNKHKRDPDEKKFYSSQRWQRMRMSKLLADPLCELCYKAGRVVVATVAHHVMPRKEGGADTMDNLQSLCNACHEREHPRGFGKRF